MFRSVGLRAVAAENLPLPLAACAAPDALPCDPFGLSSRRKSLGRRRTRDHLARIFNKFQTTHVADDEAET